MTVDVSAERIEEKAAKLHEAVNAGNIEALKPILANPEVMDFINWPDANGNSPLRNAVANDVPNQMRVMKALLNAGAEPNITREDETVRQVAKGSRNASLISDLLNKEARGHNGIVLPEGRGGR